MADAKTLFLSFAHSDMELAERLHHHLELAGFAVQTTPDSVRDGRPLGREIERAMKSSDGIVLLVAGERPKDRRQDLEWQLALEAKWEDEAKPLIPVVAAGIALPNFLAAAAAGGGAVRGVRLIDPGNLEGAAGEVARIAASPEEAAAPDRAYRSHRAHRSHLGSGALSEVAEPYESFSVSSPKSLDRESRLDEIAAHAESLLKP